MQYEEIVSVQSQLASFFRKQNGIRITGFTKGTCVQLP